MAVNEALSGFRTQVQATWEGYCDGGGQPPDEHLISGLIDTAMLYRAFTPSSVGAYEEFERLGAAISRKASELTAQAVI